MVKKYHTPTNEQLVELAVKINEILSDVKTENMKVWFQLDADNLKRFDEEYYYKHNDEIEKKNFSPADEVILDILGVNFIFTKKVEKTKDVVQIKKQNTFKKLFKGIKRLF
jgi:hypothetical protein